MARTTHDVTSPPLIDAMPKAPLDHIVGARGIEATSLDSPRHDNVCSLIRVTLTWEMKIVGVSALEHNDVVCSFWKGSEVTGVSEPAA